MSGPRIGSLFSGYGGLEQGVQAVLGGSAAWVSDIDPGACKILAHRYPDVPNLGDITAVDWSAVEPVDVLTGGFPCQDVSAAGKRAGIRPDTRSGLWSQMAYAIDQLRPRLVVIENVRGLLSADAHHPAHGDLEPCDWCVGDGERRPLRALGAVLGELADLGYDASWQGLRAADVGAPHGRFRVFVTAWPAADTGRLRGGSGRLAAAGEASGGRALGELAGRSGAHAADPHGAGPQGAQPAAGRHLPDGRPAPHAPSHGRHEGWPESARFVGGSDAALSGAPAADADRSGRETCRGRSGAWDARRLQPVVSGCEAWGQYAPAIQRWERVTGRPAPAPTELTSKGTHRLSARAVEWMQGLPAGWVTDVPGLTRNEQLKALGNGVVPQQAAAALRLLLPDMTEAAA